MAEKAPGLEFSQYWTHFVPGPPSGDQEGGGALGNWLAGVLGGLKDDSGNESTSSQLNSSGNITSYTPATNFPEVFNQQYLAPGGAAYTSNQPAVPPKNPTSLQGFITPPQYSTPAVPPSIQSPTSLQGFMTPSKYGTPTMTQQMSPTGTVAPSQGNQYLPMTNQLWGRTNG
jgi:hypothetical protein